MIKQEILEISEKVGLYINPALNENEIIKEFEYNCNVEIISWHSISASQNLSEEFIEKFADRVNWYYISLCQKLSENFIERFVDRIDWCGISYRQQLSENFIEKFADKLDWYWISSRQNLSEEFIKRNLNKISKRALIENENIEISVSLYQKLFGKS